MRALGCLLRVLLLGVLLPSQLPAAHAVQVSIGASGPIASPDGLADGWKPGVSIGAGYSRSLRQEVFLTLHLDVDRLRFDEDRLVDRLRWPADVDVCSVSGDPALVSTVGIGLRLATAGQEAYIYLGTGAAYVKRGELRVSDCYSGGSEERVFDEERSEWSPLSEIACGFVLPEIGRLRPMIEASYVVSFIEDEPAQVLRTRCGICVPLS